MVFDNGRGEAEFPRARKCPSWRADSKYFRALSLEHSLQIEHEGVDFGLNNQDRMSKQRFAQTRSQRLSRIWGLGEEEMMRPIGRVTPVSPVASMRG